MILVFRKGDRWVQVLVELFLSKLVARRAGGARSITRKGLECPRRGHHVGEGESMLGFCTVRSRSMRVESGFDSPPGNSRVYANRLIGSVPSVASKHGVTWTQVRNLIVITP